MRRIGGSASSWASQDVNVLPNHGCRVGVAREGHPDRSRTRKLGTQLSGVKTRDKKMVAVHVTGGAA